MSKSLWNKDRIIGQKRPLKISHYITLNTVRKSAPPQ